MPVSPLAAAMLTGGGMGGGESALLMDPALLQAQPELQLGQGMMQQGLSTAPAYPLQALARVVQAGLGANLYKGGLTDLARAYGGSSESLEQIFPPDSPLGAALRSPNPMVRMIALQQAPKALLLNSERYSLEPGQESHAAGSAAPTAVSGAPQSPQGKLVSDAQRAAASGNAPAAQAIGSAITKETSTPEGVQYPPTNVIPRGTQGLGATPGVAVPPPETQPTAQNMPAAIAAAKGAQEASTKLYGGASEALGKEIGGVIEAGGKEARVRINTINTIDDALSANEGKGIMTGPLADKILRTKEILDGMGIDTSWVKTGLPETEMISKMNAQLASASARAMTGRPTQFEFSAWMKNNPGLLTSKQGTHALLDILRQSSQQDVELGKLAQNKANWEHWGETVDKYYQEHPLISPFTNKPLAVSAPSRGGPQVPAPTQLPSHIPPVGQRPPGIYDTPKGKLYWNGQSWLPATAQQ